MKPYEKYPESIVWNGITYDLDLSFKAVFLVLDVLKDDQLSSEDKCFVALNIFVKNDHENDYELLNAIFDLILPKEVSNGEQTIDIEKDFKYIIPSFRQAYGIDIVRENLHYLEFVDLLNGLPDNTILVNIIKIRTMEVPQIDKYNAKEVAKILELKAKYSLRSEKNFNDGLASLFNALNGKVN